MNETEKITVFDNGKDKQEHTLPKCWILVLGAVLIFTLSVGISCGATYLGIKNLPAYRGENYSPPPDFEEMKRSIIWTSGAMHMERARISNLNKPQFEYYTCEEFRGEMDSYDRPDKYTIGELYFCAQMNTWNWLKNECISLKKCPHPRNMPGWNSMDGVMKLHATLRRMFVLLLKFTEKHPNDFQWHMVGGSLLGLLRHGDIIPHDHDGDIVIKNNAHRDFLIKHIYEFPDDLGIFHTSYVLKIMDVNGCMEKYCSNQYGPFIDLITQYGFFSMEDFTPLDFQLDWNEDVLPMQKFYLHGYAWPIPHNWPKYMAGDFSDGRSALNYVPFPLDNGAHHYHDLMCTSKEYNPVKNWKFKKKHYTWENENVILKRIDLEKRN